MEVLNNIAKRVAYCGQEHKNITQNLANIHTKNYSAVHAKPSKSFATLMQTHSNHIKSQSKFTHQKFQGVNLEKEMVLSKENASQYNQMLLLYKQITKVASKSLVK